MARLAVAMSKSSLLRLQADLDFLRAGRELLEQKREFLSEALRTFAREARAARERVEARLAEAYDAVAEAHAALGEAGLDALALAADSVGPVAVRERSLMGVIVPVAQLAGGAAEGGAGPTADALERAALRAGPDGPGLAAGVAAARLRALLPELAALAELETSCSRLARELARTRRKLNALEQVHIPAHVETIRFLAEQLEEREREALFQLKRVTALREGTS